MKLSIYAVRRPQLAVLGSILGVAALGCDRDEARQQTTTTTTPAVETVAEQPARFAGKQVILAGEVDDVHDARAFELEGNDWIFDESVLVVTKTPVRLGGTQLNDDDRVVVTGTVRNNVAEVEREVGWNLGPDLKTVWANRPVIVAQSIAGITEVARWSEAEQPEGELVGFVTVFAVPEPDKLAGQRISLDAVPVMTKAGDGLWLGFSHQSQLFVEPPKGFDTSKVKIGELVDVSGTLRKMPPAPEATKRWNFPTGLTAQVAEEPLYIAANELSPTKQKEPGKTGARDQQGQVEYSRFAADPAQYTDSQVRGEAVVDEVVSDRAFWLKSNTGQRVLAIVREDVPKHEMIDIDKGQTLRFSNARVITPDNVEQQVRGKLEPEAKRLIQQQPATLAMHWKEIDIVAG